MQPTLIKEDGTQIELPDEVYRTVLRLLREYEQYYLEPAQSFEALEAEFADLLEVPGLSTDDLLEEHRQEMQ